MFAAYSLSITLNYRHRGEQLEEGSKHDRLTRKLVVFSQLPYFVQLCSAVGAQHGCLQPRRDPAQPELKFQKKGEETNRPLTVFKRYIVLLFPACLFD